MPRRLLRLRGGRVLRGGALVKDDIWVDRESGRVVDPMALFYAAGGRAAGLYQECEELDCRGRIVAPGLVDLQFNGGFGLDFSNVRDMTGAEGAARLLACRRQLLRTGVTSFCPTLISLRPDEYRALIPLLQEATATFAPAALLAALAERDVPSGPVRTVPEALAAAPYALQSHTHPTAGEIHTVRSPIAFDGDHLTSPRHPPLLGEHTRALLLEAGFSEAEAQTALDGPCHQR